MPRVTRSIAEHRLSETNPAAHFWCHDGRILKGLTDLDGALRAMDDHTFTYHAAGESNDFGKWVEDVFGDDKLARDLGRSASRTQAARAVANRISWLRERL
jgi:hypothetical protein